MKKTILSLFILFLATGTMWAQAGQGTDKPATASEDLKDQVQFETLDHNFGEVVAGSQAKFEFVFTNESEQVLEITAVRPSCGCTAPSYSKEPVAPGQKGSIVAVYTAPSSPQAFSKSITVSTTHGTYRLMIRGTVVAAPKEPASPVKIN